MSKLNYTKLMVLEPTKYGEMTNSTGQLIEFFEHPLRGDEVSVIAVCRYHELAAYTGFYELDDMTADHKEYEPMFIDNELYIGEFKAD
jgi:hypothetical protein